MAQDPVLHGWEESVVYINLIAFRIKSKHIIWKAFSRATE